MCMEEKQMLWTLKKIWYHVFQFFFTRACYLLNWRRPELLEGAGSIKSLPSLIKSKGIDKVLVVRRHAHEDRVAQLLV